MVSYTLVTANGDPYTYAEAMESPDRERWVQDMSEEMHSLHKNDTWQLMKLPQGKKPIGLNGFTSARKDLWNKVESGIRLDWLSKAIHRERE